MKDLQEKVLIVKRHLEVDKTSWDELLDKMKHKSVDYIDDLDMLIDEYIDYGREVFNLKYLEC